MIGETDPERTVQSVEPLTIFGDETMQTVNCRYCGGDRPVDKESQRCKGCAMERHECAHKSEPEGKRPCPICDNKMVVWCEGYTKLKCIGCYTVFEPLKKGVV
jgi:ribosomal protein S27E